VELRQFEAFGAVAAEPLSAGRMKRAWPDRAFATCLFLGSVHVPDRQHQSRALQPPPGRVDIR
jgi:hypothetical protein